MLSENNIQALREARGWSRPQLAERMGTSGQQVERLEKGQRRLTTDWIDKAAEALQVMPAQIIAAGDAPLAIQPIPPSLPTTEIEHELPTIGIQHADEDFGLGATFVTGRTHLPVLQFPRVWVESITPSPANLLIWARGSGDSMHPTIDHGDLVLVDRSKTDVDEQDQLWAFTVGDTASIKRLRVKGDRFIILSDNKDVPPDEEPIDFVRIVGRVVFVGKRK